MRVPIKAVSNWITPAPVLVPPYITTFLRRCRVPFPLSLPCLCLLAISADQLEPVSALPAEYRQFFERTLTVIRSRIYPHWDASPVDITFEHAYVNILGWLCASGNHMTDALPNGTQERTRWHKPP
jgi:hypothetical protein